MNGSLRFNGIRKTTAIAVLAVFTLGFGSGIAMADDVGGEDIVVPPPAPAPAPPPPPPPPVEEDKYTLYVAGIVGYSWAKGAAFGHNNFVANSQRNNGTDWDQTVFGAGTLGLETDLGPVDVRFEIEGQGGRNYGFKTKGPVTGGGPFVSAVSTYAFFANLWMDINITERLDYYLGGGIGAGVHDFTVNQHQIGTHDVSHDDAQWAFQVGTGFSYDVIDWLTMDLGYRYVSFGKVDVNLSQPIGGDYQLKLTSHEAILGVRMNFYSF